MIQALIRAFQTSGLELTAEEIADTLWLAAYIDPSEPAHIDNMANARHFPDLPSGPPLADSDAATNTMPFVHKHDAAPPPAQTEVHLPQVEPDKRSEVGGIRAVSFRTPAATALPGKLALARSLRPLLRRIPSRTKMVLNEAATAQRIAEVRNSTPILQPGQERWLDLAIVVDEWQTMVIWHETVIEFIELLQQIGAFRTVQTYWMATEVGPNSEYINAEQVKLYATRDSRGRRGRICNPRELIDQGGRRLILVLSDCTAPIWYSGAAGHLLAHWSKSNMVALVQMLPTALWDSSMLAHAVQVYVSTLAPGLSNAELSVELPWYWMQQDKPAGYPVPVVTLEPEALAVWSKLLTGRGNASVPGFYLPLDPVITGGNEDEPVTSEKLWQRFRATASPTARELAGYLAAAPLSLPVMRLVQRVMLPQSRQVHLAEVFRSGLIQRMTPYGLIVEPDKIRYEFVKGIRELLLTTVLISDTQNVLENVSEYISKYNDHLHKFHSLILDPTSPGQFTIDEADIPFANIAIPVLRRLGARYSQLAERLERLALAESKHSNVWQSDKISTYEDRNAQYKDEDNGVRQEAAEALGQLGDHGAIESLIDITNPDSWKVIAQTKLKSLSRNLQEYALVTLYGHLCAAILTPVIETIKQGDFDVLTILVNTVGGIGGNLIANQFQQWSDQSNEELAVDLARKAQSDQNWRVILDLLLEKFDALFVVQSVLSESDKDWFVATMSQEVSNIGSTLQVKISFNPNIRLDFTDRVFGTNRNVNQIVLNYPHYTLRMVQEPMLNLSIPRLKSCVEQFFKALRSQNFNLAKEKIADLIDLEVELPEAADWSQYFDGILMIEHNHDWSNAVRIYQTLLDKPIEPVLRAHVLLALGIAYHPQAYWAESVAACQASADLWANLNYPYKQAIALRQTAVVYQMGFSDGAFGPEVLDKATACCKQALHFLGSPLHSTPDTLLYESDLLFYRASTWEVLGDIHYTAGRWADAIESYQKFLDFSVEGNNQFLASFAQLGLANAYQQYNRADWPQAHAYYVMALVGFRSYNDLYNELTVLVNQGALYLKQKAYTDALTCFERSLALVETVRAGVSTPEVRRDFFVTVVNIYANTVLAYVALGNVTQAFQTTERARSRAVLDSLFIGETDFSNRAEARPLTPSEIQRELPADALLLAYFTTGSFETHGGRVTLAQAQRAVLFPRPTTLLFAVTRESITCFDLKLMPNQLYPQDQRHWVEGNFLQPTMFAALYRMLVAPAATLLADKKRLYIVPHGPLHYVPFHALLLPDQSHWLRPEGPTLVYAPSASVLLSQRPHLVTPPPLSCLAIGYNESGRTTLYLAEEEARLVAQRLQGQALVGADAKGAALVQSAAEARLLHVSCHSEFNWTVPLLSTLYIGPEEALTGQAILETLKLRCDLVTLSACDRGLNQVQRGDELYGLVRAFLLAGATAVMTALWRVDDRPTLLFMLKFYELVQQGVAYAEALKQTQLYLQSVTLATAQAALNLVLGKQSNTYLTDYSTKDDEQIFAAPRYWAAFILIGDPDRWVN